MAEAEIFKLQLDAESLVVAFTALNFSVSEGDRNLLDVQLKGRVEEIGVVVDPRQLLGAAPGILEDLDEDVAHQRPLHQLRVLPKVEFTKQGLSASCLFDAEKAFIMQTYLGDCH